MLILNLFCHNGQNKSEWFMINLRRQLEFRYYSRNEKCKGKYALIGKSPIVEPINYNEQSDQHKFI